MILTNARILTFDRGNRVIQSGSVEVLPDGSIGRVIGSDEHVSPCTALRAGNEAEPSDRTIDLRGRLLMPALINCHTHLYSTLARGMPLRGARPADFTAILKKVWWRLDCALSEEDVYYSALLGLMDSARCGVGTVIDHHSSPKACAGSLDPIERAFQETGLRGATCYEVSDRNGPTSAQEGIQENVRFLEGRRPDCLVRGMFGLHAAFTLTDRTLSACAEANQSVRGGFHVHVAEDRIDRAGVRRLEAAGILDDRTIAAHCIHLTAADRDRLARHGVNVVHNPQSNNNNAVGVCDVPALVRRGVLVGLGSDGYSPRLWDEYKAALQMEKQRARDPRVHSPDLLWNNRAIVKKIWGVELGRIEAGARADLQILDYYPPTPIDSENLSGHLLFGIANAPVDSLMVEGRFVVRDKQFVNLDEHRIAEQAAIRAKALWERL